MGLNISPMPLIHIEKLSKRFGVNAALQDVDLTLEAGSIHALLGQNGAGKSTLIKILSGLYTATSGSITVAGHPLGTPEAAADMAFIHQDLGLVDSMTIAENIALGTGFGKAGGFISWRQVRDAAAEALQTVASHLEPDRHVSELTRADKSLVAIARALATSAKVIILDEPTASLPAADSRRLFEVLEKLRSKGHGLLYVSHRLDEVFAISDTVTVLRDGRLIHTGPIAQKSPRELVVDIVGHKPASYSSGHGVQQDVERLQVTELGTSQTRAVSFSVHAGEVVGMVGLTGAGHMELGRALAGAHKITSGSALLDSKSYAPRTPAEAVDAGVGFVTSNRMEEGCAPELSIRENFLPNPGIRSKNPFAWTRPKTERQTAVELVERYGVRPALTEVAIATLSGGNQQKIMIGRWLNTGRKLIILEEPTAGVDVGAKADIYTLLEESLADGLAVLMISTDFEEVANVCHRALVFVQGTVTAELSGPELTIANLTAAASGAALTSE
ncbi:MULTISPECIES: sugar ABC transporter ATP-binding protein [Arthrobacter]|uniref:Sugar ABC transporter ATP-binding protein n=1 Tax=Arthrobacter terricola TaxID=2547396 RepID=A0A4R5K5W4_9MICC|nr:MULTISPECIES: sugar ABC transporter ATP-binding protein [Arthrobacter]MBT8162899.1 sugar ABC transporter ATP-binding protein [Arthrobacter sp. GN70]TDF86440.1 sugar ABC transporter ATP-binding protein [Arthrobacter terricola]